LFLFVSFCNNTATMLGAECNYRVVEIQEAQGANTSVVRRQAFDSIGVWY